MIDKHQIAQNRFSRDQAYLDTLKSNMPQLDALFEKLAAQEHPDFWTVMAAISEMVAFHVDNDLNRKSLSNSCENMSQKKCRFCD